MAAPKAPLLDGSGKKSKDVSLEEAVYAAEVKPHLVHEAVRAELNAQRAGTFAPKSRGLVSGGRSKPWRQKGTGRARAGTTRAPYWTGGGVVFGPQPRSYTGKVNRKARLKALRVALSAHAGAGSLHAVDGGAFDEPKTAKAAELVAAAELRAPLVVIVTGEETNLGKSFRNLHRTHVVDVLEVEVADIVWARALIVSKAALSALEGGESS
jgi:large subunit ribosomal protein L4